MGTRGREDRHRREFCRERAISSRCAEFAAARSTARANVWRRLGMDAQLLFALPRLPRRTGRAWRVQRQIHVQPVRAARRLVRDFARSHSKNLSQFLSTRQAVAIHRDPFGSRSFVNEKISPAVEAAAKENFREEVLRGLAKKDRELPCKFFYDERGAQLFQQICELPEYYITRTEIEILRLHGAEMASALGSQIELIGLGTGAGTKTRILLQELRDPRVYVPIDISKEQLERSSARFQKTFPALQILPVAADYLEPFELPLPRHLSSRSVVYFPGSTIGNFESELAGEFLTRLVELAGDGGGLLIGVDLQKDRDVLERAYNDAAGVTAEFNKNLLARINRELGADFDLNRWQHHAIYNPTEGRIEIYLISDNAQAVHIGVREFQFRAGEEILTEYSYKNTIAGFIELAPGAALHFEQLRSDAAGWLDLLFYTYI